MGKQRASTKGRVEAGIGPRSAGAAKDISKHGKGSVTGKSDRRAQIADAALKVLAREGARRVTHRTIDRFLGLPEGSTSYYFRTRVELLSAAAHRLVELDLSDMTWQAEMAGKPAGAVRIEDYADRLSETLLDWLSPEKRDRTLAKSELFLETSRDETIRQIMLKIRHQFGADMNNVFRVLGARNPEQAAYSLLLFTLGAVYSRALTPSGELDREGLRLLTRSVITACTNR
jgi:AcrR family transcriptional regulator